MVLGACVICCGVLAETTWLGVEVFVGFGFGIGSFASVSSVVAFVKAIQEPVVAWVATVGVGVETSLVLVTGL